MRKEDLRKLKSNLPYAYGSKLEKITKKTRSAIYKALDGKINSPEIIKAAIKLARESKQKESGLSQEISEL